jgi:hypothetical protein
MEGLLARLSPILHLTRVTTAFAAVANVWFIILWTRAGADEFAAAPGPLRELPLWVLLSGGALYAVGLFCFATALNDTLDVRRDRLLNPERPIPSGRISVDAAAALVAFTLLAAGLGAAVLGLPAVLMFLLTSSATLVYHTMARYLPSFGLVCLGLVYGAHMMSPNPYLIFVWPVLLVMAHALLLGAVAHKLGGKRPTLTWPRLWSAAAGWAFWSGILLYVGWVRAGTLWPAWVSPWAAVGPALLAASFLLLAWNKARVTRDADRAADKIRRYGSLWVALYGAAWMAGQGWMREGIILGALALAGVLGMTVMREVYGLIERPVGWRR